MKTRLIKILLFCFISNFILINNLRAAIPNVASLSFAWPVPVALSVFKRGEHVWIVFDKKQIVDINEIKNTLRIFSPEILEIPHSKATILRIRPSREVSISVRKEGLLWIVDFIDGKKEIKGEKLQAIVEVDGLDKPYVFVPSTSLVEPISVIDPDVGDYIKIIPATKAGVGMFASYRYVDFDFLYSYQGVAVLNKINDLYTIVGNRGLSIKSYAQGLRVSRGLDEMQREAELASRDDVVGAFDFELPKSLLEKSFIEAEAKLKNDIRITGPKTKNIARMDLAKYYLTQGLGFEALAVIDTVLQDDFDVEEKEKIYSLRGIANFIAKRYNEAIADFSYNNLKNNAEASFWKNASLAAIDVSLFNENISDFAGFIKRYPSNVQTRLASIVAQIAIDRRDDLLAQNMIDVIKMSSQKNKYLLPKLNYYIAQNYSLQGYDEDAIKYFDITASSGSQKYSSLARFDGALLSYILKKKNVNETISELERVKFAWGEINFKKAVYNVLIKLYVEKKDYQNAIETAMVEYNFSNKKDKEEIKQKIFSLFEDLYINNLADDVSALKILSVYKKHIALIKQSPKFVDILISVADRFFAVDLLDNAKELLEEELEKKDISSEQKYKMGTRLALIYIAEDDMIKALEVLDETEMQNPLVSLENYRNVLRAKVYKNQEDYETALNLLDDNYSDLAILLRSEIYWLNQDWHELSFELKHLIKEPVEGEPLADDQVKYLLDWLMALKKSGKDVIIARVRAKFEPWFKDTKYYSSFDVLTSQFDYDKVDIKDIEERINNLASYSDFSKRVNENLKVLGKSEARND